MATIDINIGLVAAAGGTADAITATFSPAFTGLTDQMKVWVVASGANLTTTPSFSPNGLAAHTIVKRGGLALVAGDIPNSLFVISLEYNLANTRWELLNPGGIIAPRQGGTGVDTSLLSGIPRLGVGVWTFSTALPSGTTAITEAPGTNNTRIATTAYTDAAVLVEALARAASDALLLAKANNLSDVANAATSRTNLGATTVGGNLFIATNPSAITYIRVNADNSITFLTAAQLASTISVGDHSVICDTGNGHGSVATKIRRFTNSVTVGTAITYADSAANGATFTANENGIYGISYTDSYDAGYGIGISKNSANLTTNIFSLSASERIRGAEEDGANYHTNVGFQIKLVIGDIIRAHNGFGAANASTGSGVQFNIVKLASL